jgi:pyruvate/2-oxoglutarate dehydrogenase complex dihydrolipoamide dehydrogenase (E3) component
VARPRAMSTSMPRRRARRWRSSVTAVLGKASGVASSGIVPRVTFTDPQICTAGRTERQARDEGLDVRAVA